MRGDRLGRQPGEARTHGLSQLPVPLERPCPWGSDCRGSPGWVLKGGRPPAKEARMPGAHRRGHLTRARNATSLSGDKVWRVESFILFV